MSKILLAIKINNKEDAKKYYEAVKKIYNNRQEAYWGLSEYYKRRQWKFPLYNRITEDANWHITCYWSLNKSSEDMVYIKFKEYTNNLKFIS